MQKKATKAAYYEKNGFSTLIHDSKGKIFSPAITKRITMNISELAYQEAHVLDKWMNMGYQNVLKTAIILGLNDLFNQINLKRKIKV
jgi:hypothetical protein